jgi:hypothetical protein
MTTPEVVGQNPGVFDASFAAALDLEKRAVVQASEVDQSATVTQFGCAYLDATIALPDPPADRSLADPLIDMFVCGSNGSCQPTGSDAALNALWQPAVEAMAETVYAALRRFEVPVAPVAYVTASFTSGAEVVGEAHLDDEQFLPDAGVGVVAILGSDIGPRVATEPVEVPHPRPGLPLEVAQATFDRFTAGDLPYHQVEAGRIVIFPQFGQLHAGPALASANPEITRRLLVLRAETIPTVG